MLRSTSLITLPSEKGALDEQNNASSAPGYKAEGERLGAENEQLRARCADLTRCLEELSSAKPAETVAQARWIRPLAFSLAERHQDHIRQPTLPTTRVICGGKEDEEEPQVRRRTPSATSSILYAGVEQKVALMPARPASRVSLPSNDRPEETQYQPPRVTVGLISDLNEISQGGWLYKYPRRGHDRLYRREEIPRTYLTYRYFQLIPYSGRLLWSESPGSSPAKQVRIVDFLTEDRKLPAEEGGGLVTILVVLTDEGSPLMLVPATRKDLEVWQRGLEALMELRRLPDWPRALNLCLRLDV